MLDQRQNSGVAPDALQSSTAAHHANQLLGSEKQRTDNDKPIPELVDDAVECCQTVASQSPLSPAVRRCPVPPALPWREYIAVHDKCDLLVGEGIVRFYLYFMPELDPNRRGQLRLNYVIERQDGSAVLLHPGGRPAGDAKPVLLGAAEAQSRLGHP